jgi:hypothetical protein
MVAKHIPRGRAELAYPHHQEIGDAPAKIGGLCSFNPPMRAPPAHASAKEVRDYAGLQDGGRVVSRELAKLICVRARESRVMVQDHRHSRPIGGERGRRG